jgi:FixJ family two-component response regulator
MNETRQTVFVVDDDPAARDSLAALIESRGLRVATFVSAEDVLQRYVSPPAESENGETAHAAHEEIGEPECFIFDLRMSGMSGIELQTELRRRGITTPVIIITAYGTVNTAVKAMQSGVVTFLEKPCPENLLWESITRALEQNQQRRQRQAQQAEIRRRLDKLTDSEHTVLHHLLEGKPNKVIAAELGMGLRTVELRRANVLKKMRAGSIAELVRLILEDRTDPQLEDRSPPS